MALPFRTLLSGLAGLSLLVASLPAGTPDHPLDWPVVGKEAKPWTYWWWLGSAVNEGDLSRELVRYQQAGLGGVHIIPIYGAKGAEDQSIPYLTPEWMSRLDYTVRTARKLGLGVDMTTGTGWCFGGPNVSTDDANANVVCTTERVAQGSGLTAKFKPGATQTLMAFPSSGSPVELTSLLRPDGGVPWVAPAGDWTVYAVSQKFSGVNVKRPAPGGAGRMLNLLYPTAMTDYLQRFTEAFASYTGEKPRAVYHDSYEYRSDWAPDLLKQFQARRGYRLQDELPAFFGTANDDHTARVKSDYRQTVSEVMAEDSIEAWARWAHGLGFVTRNQAHGSPGNLLDLYAAADIPETEMFKTERDILVSKFASSAAHVTGKKLASAETGTWLAEHFTETLGALRVLQDTLFLSGINHLFYHGTAYSPDAAPWPGWLFYASTEMNPRNSIWHDVGALNAYVARCQSVLQSGASDNDLLLYWPIFDRWHDANGRLVQFSVEERSWLHDQPIGLAAHALWEKGYAFDYVSDQQLLALHAEGGRVHGTGPSYAAVLVPKCQRMPLETFQQLLGLAEAGGTVIFEDALPDDVPGNGDLAHRRNRFKALAASLPLRPHGTVQWAAIGAGRVMVGPLANMLAGAGIRREPMVEQAGAYFVRRAVDGGRFYFVVNRGEAAIDAWVPLATSAVAVALMDPMRGQTGFAGLRRKDGDVPEVHLQLDAGASLILRTFETRPVPGQAWEYWKPDGAAVPLAGNWSVAFIDGGPVLPAGFRTNTLGSWTAQTDPETQRFAGTARYTLTFAAPAPELPHWTLNLGDVRQSARVSLNGQDLGTWVAAPFRVSLPPLLPTGNVLVVEVTNVSANRIRDLDRRQVNWKYFSDINFVNIDYKPFDASRWATTDSGLLGPVTLQPDAPSFGEEPSKPIIAPGGP